MLFLVVVCASLLAGVAGVTRASRMPKLELTTPAPTPSAIARVYGRRIPTAVRELEVADTVRFRRTC